MTQHVVLTATGDQIYGYIVEAKSADDAVAQVEQLDFVDRIIAVNDGHMYPMQLVTEVEVIPPPRRFQVRRSEFGYPEDYLRPGSVL